MTENKTSVTFNKSEIRANTKVAFDVDLTLITHEDRPILSVINILDWFVRGGFDVIIWSGGGVSYAEMWARRLGYIDRVRVIEKGSEEVNLAFDDEEFSLAKTNICVPAVNFDGTSNEG